MKVERGGPPAGRTTGHRKYAALLDAAEMETGEWFHAETPSKHAASMLATKIKRLEYRPGQAGHYDATTRGATVYLRWTLLPPKDARAAYKSALAIDPDQASALLGLVRLDLEGDGELKAAATLAANLPVLKLTTPLDSDTAANEASRLEALVTMVNDIAANRVRRPLLLCSSALPSASTLQSPLPLPYSCPPLCLYPLPYSCPPLYL